MTDAQALAATIVGLARAGDIAGAILVGEDAIARGKGDAALAMFVGMLCCRQGDLARGIDHLKNSVGAAPDSLPARVELARALLSAGANEDAAEIARPLAEVRSPPGREMQRILAHAVSRLRAGEEAAQLFEALTQADPQDFESWRGLGVARLLLPDLTGAIAALTEATRLRPAVAGHWVDLARAHAANAASDRAIEAARRAVDLAPTDPGAQLEYARALSALRRFGEATQALSVARARTADNPDSVCAIAEVELGCKATDRAEADFRRAIVLRPDLARAWRGLANVLERTSRASELRDLVAAGERAGVSRQAMALARARALRSEGRLAEASTVLAEIDDDSDQVERAQLAGDIADRLGDADTAFAAFSKANALLPAVTGDVAYVQEHAAAYLATFRDAAAAITRDWYRNWGPPPPNGARRTPVFVFGFPRSGTTLIDTLLGGHPNTVVLEEEPTVGRLSEAVGSIEHVGALTDAEIARARAIYFDTVDRIVPDVGDRLIVDKQPLALGSTAALHRVFPDARFVFVERHPCDVVLSCFMMSGQMDAKVANFFDFTSTARLYDQVLAFWTRCREVLPITVFNARYERLIADPEREMRALAEFIGIAWDARLLTNQDNAAARVYIGSPSYSQVAEPIYARATGRWLRYRRHLEPVMPILRPWIERMGYDPGDQDQPSVQSVNYL